MASASRDPKSRHVTETDVVTCPICHGLFNSPKFLPCYHTFCLKCIDDHCKAKRPDDELSCPVCRQTFKIPDTGVQGLVSNFLIADLLEARKTASDVVDVPAVPCEVCSAVSSSGEVGSSVAAATKYCVECDLKYCEGCSGPHRMWRGEAHRVVPIWDDIKMDMIQALSGKCDKHKNDDAKLNCLDCKMDVCVSCFTVKHLQHKCYYVGTLAARCVEEIDADMELVRKRADGARNDISRLGEERRQFLADVDEVGEKIVERGEELKQLIDKQVNELLAEVQVLKTEKCKKIESHKENVEERILAFETFSAYCCELKAAGKPCDITRAANDVHIRATKLLQNDVTLSDFCAPAVTFRPTNVHKLLADGQNLVGAVNPKELIVAPVPVVHALPEAQDVWGVTSLGDELYVLRHIISGGSHVDVYSGATTTTTTLYSFLRHLSVPGLKFAADITSCKQYRCLYISDFNDKRVYKVKLNSKVTKWSVSYQPLSLSVTSQFTVIVTCRDVGKLLEFTTGGKQVREINLHQHIPSPWHTIQLPNGQFVVSHGNDKDPVRRVCIVDTNGQVTQSYGGPPGSASVGQLNTPIHLAVDKDGLTFVLDPRNRRVLLLSPTLSFVREIVSRDQLKWEPIRLFVDDDRRRLFVADSAFRDKNYMTGRVVVVNY